MGKEVLVGAPLCKGMSPGLQS
ncbi:MAG: hypothetical protein JWN02_2720, partial [Acidobacteria bacterium]|nr:hypothetical protein [Acidobacteriota bacterium]